MATYPIKGSCLCQQVEYQVDADLGVFQYCHCSRCRKFTGSAFAANLLVAPEDFHWVRGEDKVVYFPLPEVRHFATAFCSTCGSSLPWAAQSGKAVVVPAGGLDQAPPRQPQQNIYCASRALWYRDPASLPEHDELPPRRG